MRHLIEKLGGYISERQKGDAALTYPGQEKPVRKGAFKMSSKMLKWWKDEGGIANPEEMLFKHQKEYINKIPYEKLPEIWGAENMPDAQDEIARNPKGAMRMWMKNIGKVAPKLGGAIRSTPENVTLWFYATILRVVGRDMADLIIKKYFSTEGGI